METYSRLYALDNVRMDDAEGTALALRHLAELGHHHVTMIVNEPEAALSVAVRRDTFEQMCPQLGLNARVISCKTQYWENSYEAAYNAMAQVWSEDADKRPTAVMTVSDAGAWAVLKWLNQREIKVPDDVSVMGFNDSRPSLYSLPALTTIRTNAKEMVRATLDLLNMPKAGHAEVLVHPHLIIRESTAQCCAARRKRRPRKQHEGDLAAV
jgi:LacI family transcriptional regulator